MFFLEVVMCCDSMPLKKSSRLEVFLKIKSSESRIFGIIHTEALGSFLKHGLSKENCDCLVTENQLKYFWRDFSVKFWTWKKTECTFLGIHEKPHGNERWEQTEKPETKLKRLLAHQCECRLCICKIRGKKLIQPLPVVMDQYSKHMFVHSKTWFGLKSNTSHCWWIDSKAVWKIAKRKGRWTLDTASRGLNWSFCCETLAFLCFFFS